MSDDEYTDDVRAAHRRIDTLDAQLQELRIQLFGDVEARELYKKNRENNTAPNIPEPPVGIIESILNSTDSMRSTWTQQLGTVLDALKWARKLEQFFSPMMADGALALDIGLIATKKYVDDGITTFAKAIRGEIANVRGELVLVVGNARDIANHLVTGALSKFDPRRDNEATTTHKMIADRLAWVWAREHERAELEAERARTPSRMQSLIHAVTGYSKPTNGAHR